MVTMAKEADQDETGEVGVTWDRTYLVQDIPMYVLRRRESYSKGEDAVLTATKRLRFPCIVVNKSSCQLKPDSPRRDALVLFGGDAYVHRISD